MPVPLAVGSTYIRYWLLLYVRWSYLHDRWSFRDISLWLTVLTVWKTCTNSVRLTQSCVWGSERRIYCIAYVCHACVLLWSQFYSYFYSYFHHIVFLYKSRPAVVNFESVTDRCKLPLYLVLKAKPSTPPMYHTGRRCQLSHNQRPRKSFWVPLLICLQLKMNSTMVQLAQSISPDPLGW